MCQDIATMIDYSFDLAFTPMRNKQDEVSARLKDELEVLAIKDVTTQYVLISICVGLVVITTVSITPIFIWVIKDKCYVFTIFAYIQLDEIRDVIKECKKPDFKGLKFKAKWIVKCEGQEQLFWNRLVNHRFDNSVRNIKDRARDQTRKGEGNFSDLATRKADAGRLRKQESNPSGEIRRGDSAAKGAKVNDMLTPIPENAVPRPSNDEDDSESKDQEEEKKEEHEQKNPDSKEEEGKGPSPASSGEKSGKSSDKDVEAGDIEAENVVRQKRTLLSEIEYRSPIKCG